MTWSFQIKNGDLNFAGPGGFAIVTGTQKLIQDLRNWLLEPRGSDPFHSEYGSTLDGGTLGDGSMVPPSIGGMFTGEDLLNIEVEIRRILTLYQQQQASRIKTENIRYSGKNTYSRGEILHTVQDVDIRQSGDTAIVRISLITASGDSIQFSQPLAL